MRKFFWISLLKTLYFIIKYMCSTISNSYKLETTQIFINGRLDMLWYIHTMEYHTGVRMCNLQLLATQHEWISQICWEKKRRQRNETHCFLCNLFKFQKIVKPIYCLKSLNSSYFCKTISQMDGNNSHLISNWWKHTFVETFLQVYIWPEGFI